MGAGDGASDASAPGKAPRGSEYARAGARWMVDPEAVWAPGAEPVAGDQATPDPRRCCSLMPAWAGLGRASSRSTAPSNA
jgi:hypothetical protein